MRWKLFELVAAAGLTLLAAPALSQTQGEAGDGPGGPASWTTGNKLAVGAAGCSAATIRADTSCRLRASSRR